MNELTAKDLRRRAWALLAGANGAAGYGTYVFGLLLNVLVVFVVIVLITVLFVGAFAGLYAYLKGVASEAPTVGTYVAAFGVSAVAVILFLYVVGFASWGQTALAVALVRGGLTARHGLSGWGNGWRMVSLILWRQTFVFLWALLFVVPGVRAFFSYAMTPYLLVDHPDWTPRRCIAESKRMMEGHRWRYFCLNVSFLGWTLLAAVTSYFFGGLTQLLLTPYIDAACAAFYEDLLDRAERAAGAPAAETPEQPYPKTTETT